MRSFDLEHAVAEWRRRMLDRTALGGESVRELESHLRETVDELRATGLADEVAFAEADARLGEPESVGAEFVQVEGNGRLREYGVAMVSGMLLLPIIAQAVRLGCIGIAVALDLPAVWWDKPYPSGLATCGMLAVSFALVLLGMLVFGMRWQRVPTVIDACRGFSNRRKVAFVAASSALGMLLGQLVPVLMAKAIPTTSLGTALFWSGLAAPGMWLPWMVILLVLVLKVAKGSPFSSRSSKVVLAFLAGPISLGILKLLFLGLTSLGLLHLFRPAAWFGLGDYWGPAMWGVIAHGAFGVLALVTVVAVGSRRWLCAWHWLVSRTVVTKVLLLLSLTLVPLLVRLGATLWLAYNLRHEVFALSRLAHAWGNELEQHILVPLLLLWLLLRRPAEARIARVT